LFPTQFGQNEHPLHLNRVFIKSFETATANRFVFQINNDGVSNFVDFIVLIVLPLYLAISEIQIIVQRIYHFSEISIFTGGANEPD
jgi:hypothetical protein